MIVFDLEYCLYCHGGRLDVTTDWVECDKCLGFVHQKCDDINMNKSYSGSFVCRLCLPSEHKTIKIQKSSVDLLEFYTEFLDTLKLSLSDQEIMEATTKSQRTSIVWNEERRKRLTASNFGRVIKCRSSKSMVNMARNILKNRDLSNIPSIK